MGLFSRKEETEEKIDLISSKKSKVTLGVAEALQDDAYRGIARIDPKIMKELGILSGNAIIIKGSKETVAIADKAYSSDVEKEIIRIDEIIRKNAKTEVGEDVIVSKANVREAKRIVIAPVQKGIRVQGDLGPALLGRAIIKGDIVVFGGIPRRKDFMNDEIGTDEILGNLDEIFGNSGNLGEIQQIKFIAANTNPTGPCIITENTEVIITEANVEKVSELDTYISKNKIINIKKLPNNIKDYYEVESLQDLFKLHDNDELINKYEDENKIVLIFGSYYFTEEKKKKLL